MRKGNRRDRGTGELLKESSWRFLRSRLSLKTETRRFFASRTRASRTPVEMRQCCEPSLESPTLVPTREVRGQRRGAAAFLSFSKSRHFSFYKSQLMLRSFHRPFAPQDPQWPRPRRSPAAKSRPRRWRNLSLATRRATADRALRIQRVRQIVAVLEKREADPPVVLVQVQIARVGEAMVVAHWRPREGKENFPPRKALKSHETRKSSTPPVPATEERGHRNRAAGFEKAPLRRHACVSRPRR
jgi:hypothetical protein